MSECIIHVHNVLLFCYFRVHITFTGKSSHAAAFPWDGINALDAAVMCYQSISVLRQQMKPTWRVHGKTSDRVERQRWHWERVGF